MITCSAILGLTFFLVSGDTSTCSPTLTFRFLAHYRVHFRRVAKTAANILDGELCKKGDLIWSCFLSCLQFTRDLQLMKLLLKNPIKVIGCKS